ncbi:MAG: hypothetical protein M9890_14275, partial [Thermomicrobiales bacterium]|nr:hypothetical protein [Thermomicrobiales bacterium]
MTATALVSKDRFIGGDERAYLLTAGDGLTPVSAVDATARYFADKANGSAGLRAQQATAFACREGLAALLGVDAGDVALLGSTSE